METPILFSIIIPTYNRASFIVNTINAFVAQSYPRFEIIVVDDGSKDNTEEVMKSVTDPRVSYHKKENGERGAARNYGLAIAKGDYVNFFDSDDLAYPTHLEAACRAVLQLGHPEVFHMGYDIKSPEGKLLSEHNSFNGDIEKYAIRTKQVSINALFVKRQVADAIRFSENRLLSASEDALFLCQLCARYPLRYDNTITSTIIEHDSRSMVVANEQQLLNRRKFMIEGLEADSVFMEKYKNDIPYIAREFDYLLCLSSLSQKNNKKALQYFRSYNSNGNNLFSARTLVFIKKYMGNWF